MLIIEITVILFSSVFINCTDTA